MRFGHMNQVGADIWLTLIGMALVGLIIVYLSGRKK